MCVGVGRMYTMPKAFPREFREDVIRVHKDSDASVAQVAKVFGCAGSWAGGRRSGRSAAKKGILGGCWAGMTPATLGARMFTPSHYGAYSMYGHDMRRLK
jgi:hypothetical protein